MRFRNIDRHFHLPIFEITFNIQCNWNRIFFPFTLTHNINVIPYVHRSVTTWLLWKVEKCFYFRRQAPPRPYDARDPSSERWNCGRECFADNFSANLRHGTDGFSSPSKEGALRILFALKFLTASAGFEPANLGI